MYGQLFVNLGISGRDGVPGLTGEVGPAGALGSI